MAKPRRKSTPPPKSSSKPKAKAKPVRGTARSVPKVRKPVKATTKASIKPKPKTPARPALKAPAASRPARHGKAPAPKGRPAPNARRPGKRAPAPPALPPRRSTYVDALAAYERGIQALQSRKYRDAAEILRSVIAQFPEEKELHERAALYIRVCEGKIATAPPPVETAEDRVYAATLALNNGAIDQAISLLSSVLDTDADHDGATYMLGVSYALKGNGPAALQHLARSMALNPENRDMARKEPDLEPLRRTDEMRALLAAPPAALPRKEKKTVKKASR